MNTSDSFTSYPASAFIQVKNIMACIFTFLMLVIFSPDMFAQDITQVQPLNGTAGTSVIIYGLGLDATNTDNTVRFTPVGGGSATTATVTSASATKLTITVPTVTGGNYTLSVQ